MGVVQATVEEQAAIRAMLSKRAESAPAGAGVGRASAWARAGLRLAAIVLLAAGVGVGLGDGDEFDDVGCSVALQPDGTSHGAHSAQTRERAGGKMPGSDSGSAGSSGDGGPDGGKAETLKAESRNGGNGPEAGAVVKAVEAAIERILGGRRFADWQKGGPTTPQPVCAHRACPAGAFKAAIEGDPTSGSFAIRVSPANEAGRAAMPEPSQRDEPNLSLTAKVFQLLTALDPDNRLRKAPPIKVFLLRYRQNRSLSEIARTCDCGKSLVALRLKTLQEKLPWQPQQLRELSAHIEGMQDALSDSRARRIYRKGADYGEEEDREASE
jgi:hypothetical protein